MTEPDDRVDRLSARVNALEARLREERDLAAQRSLEIMVRALTVGVLVITAATWIDWAPSGNVDETHTYAGLSLITGGSVIVDSTAQRMAMTVLVVGALTVLFVPVRRLVAPIVSVIMVLASVVVLATKRADTDLYVYTWHAASRLCLLLTVLLFATTATAVGAGRTRR